MPHTLKTFLNIAEFFPLHYTNFSFRFVCFVKLNMLFLNTTFGGGGGGGGAIKTIRINNVFEQLQFRYM